ncbi:MAG: PD40 domain-containing protein [Armatimonadetes bacterium]|nr:PD40 domain-containing protein [Armatimonadota bacterium]
MIATTLAVVTLAQSATTEMKLLRMPAVSGDTVAFVYGGDIWTSDLKGGTARRVTTSPGSESWPRFSPDGKWIAFSGNYDSLVPQVYVVSAEGGEPLRLTYESEPCNVVGWTPDGKVAYASSYGSPFTGRLWLISPNGGMPQRTDLGEFTNGSFSADGKQIAYNRNNSYAFNWRRYRGGTQGKVCFYDFAQRKYWEVPGARENNYWPMWVGDKVFYLSDKTQGNVNLWSYDTKSKSSKQVTDFDDGDMKNASNDGSHIVFERNGTLYSFDVATSAVEPVKVKVATDALLARSRYRKFGDSVDNGSISPSGKRAALVARGEIYSVPAKNGQTRNLTEAGASREEDPDWSPDGQTVAFLSDKTGERRIYTVPQMGGDWTEVATPKDQKIQRFGYFPDGKKFWYTTVDSTLFVYDPATKTSDRVYANPGFGNTFDVSFDGNWIAYSQAQPNLFSAVYLYNVKSKASTKVTEGYYDDSAVAFDLNGKYLYFVSSRTFGANPSPFEIGLYQQNVQRVYAAILSKDQTSPLMTAGDEEPVKEEGKTEAKPESKPEGMRVDLEGLDQRVVPLPWGPGNYPALIGAENGVMTIANGTLLKFDFDSKQSQPILAGFGGGSFNGKRTKVLYFAAGVVGIGDVRPGLEPNAGRIPLGDIATEWSPRQEWAQIYWEAWRHERDNFYDVDMLGLDWKAIGDKYAALLPYCSNRSDLTYLIGLMIGELGTGHAYVQGGESGFSAPGIPTGMLGADFETAGEAVRFKKVYKGLNFEPERRGPLGAPGVNVNDGDYLIAINGKPVTSKTNLHRLLIDKVEKDVVLTVNDKAGTAGSRKVTVRPIADETDLRYISWVEGNREYVKKVSGGKIGYIHVPNTNVQGIIEFVKGYYSNSSAEAFVIDERYNGGGWIPTFFIEFLTRSPQTVFKPRYGVDQDLPGQALVGPKAMLINEFAGSGGDMFPWLFKRNKIGPLIGTRTWGGLVGIQGAKNLVDGGGVTAPAFGIYDKEKGEWIAENKGVDPDIEVDARPDQIAAGKDAVLDKAIEWLTAEMKKVKRDRPVPPFPKVKK